MIIGGSLTLGGGGGDAPTTARLVNLIPNSSFEKDNGWAGVTYDNTQALFGKRSSKLAAEGTVMNNITMPSPIVGHTYYGRHSFKTNGNANPADCRFEWYAGDGEGLNFVFGWNRGDYPQWYTESAVIPVTSVLGTSYYIRNFTVNSGAEVWCDGLMIVDLTEAFGAGNEPSKEWCDDNIPYFEGTFLCFMGDR